MALKRNVGFFTGLRYQGGGPMWAWILHRISGLGMILFVSLHVMAGFLTHVLGNDTGILINTVYESVYFQVFIFFCVIFHTLNGARIIVLDTWPKLIEYQREVTWLQWLIFVPIYGLTVFIMVTRVLSGK
jgi:succinate dehydrogenase / fumarate reductase cytochrome b subunit